jgi:hypothetical protein
MRNLKNAIAAYIATTEAEREPDFTLYEYFFRWKFLVTFGGSFIVIPHIVLRITTHEVPPAVWICLSQITRYFILAGWIIFWIARFNSHSITTKNIEDVFSFIVAIAYGTFLFLYSSLPLYMKVNWNRGDGSWLLWGLSFFLIFFLMTHFLEKEGSLRALLRIVASLHRMSQKN